MHYFHIECIQDYCIRVIDRETIGVYIYSYHYFYFEGLIYIVIIAYALKMNMHGHSHCYLYSVYFVHITWYTAYVLVIILYVLP